MSAACRPVIEADETESQSTGNALTLVAALRKLTNHFPLAKYVLMPEAAWAAYQMTDGEDHVYELSQYLHREGWHESRAFDRAERRNRPDEAPCMDYAVDYERRAVTDANEIVARLLNEDELPDWIVGFDSDGQAYNNDSVCAWPACEGCSGAMEWEDPRIAENPKTCRDCTNRAVS